MGNFLALEGDCLVVLKQLPDNSIDSVVTDPPYGISFMGKEWDDFKNEGAAFEEWSRQWAVEVFRVLKPGGHLISFGGTRTYHRMTTGIEDAGFEVRDCLLWMYGSGFPKSPNLEGGRGTALKPAYEPAILARKPLIGTVLKNIEVHQTGALNIDPCRIPGENPSIDRRKSTPAGSVAGRTWKGDEANENRWREGRSKETYQAQRPGELLGRWPANVILDEEAGSVLDAQVEGVARFFYCPKVGKKERGESKHPTMKPIALMEYLVKLVTPPGGTVLDPFSGSFSTGVAALRAGFRFIGIERDPSYLAAGRARMDAVAAKPQGENS